MKEGATAKAKELGVTLKSYAGKIDGDLKARLLQSKPASLTAQRVSF